MRRTDRFLVSQRPYAVDLSSFELETNVRDGGRLSWYGEITAVWFRRRGKGSGRVTVACIGRLWDYQATDPGDVYGFLRQHDDGRYGGDCWGRWDGTGYWGVQDLTVMQEHLKILRPMLDQFPAVPPGFDGWWTFH